jgi:hypothetical protein
MTMLEVAAVAVLAALLAALVVAAVLHRGRDEVSGLLQSQAVRLDRLAESVGRQALEDREVAEGLADAREALELMRARAEERMRSEEAGWDAIRSLEAVLAGGSSRGRAGENVLGEVLSALPAGMLVSDFRVGGRVVEFALVLPDGRRLPIDSKWTGWREVEALDGEADPARRAALCREIERQVAARAREVAGYLDPVATTPFAVAAVPDPVYAACRKAHVEAFSRGVVLVPYSTALPVLLSLFVLAARHGRAGDMEACLAEIDGVLAAMEATLENKAVRAGTMLHNATEEWRSHLGRARTALARGRGMTVDPPAEPVLRAVDGAGERA